MSPQEKFPSPSRSQALARSLFLLLFAFSLAPAAFSQTYIWTGVTNNNWGTGTNWSPSNPGAGAADIIIDFSTLDLVANRNVNIQAANRTAGTLRFGDTVVEASTNYVWNINTGGGSFILSSTTGTGIIDVVNRTVNFNAILAGTGGVTKIGAGTLALANATNTLTGGIFLEAGTLTFISGSLNNNLVTSTGNASLGWSGHNDDVSSLIKLGDGFALTLSLSNTASDVVTFATALQTGPLGTGSLTKANASTLLITAANTYTGGTRINNGRIILTGGDNRLSTSGSVSLGNNANAGILQLGDATAASHQTVTALLRTSNLTTAPSNRVVGGNAAVSTLTINNATANNYDGSFGGAGINEDHLALIKTGVGNLTLSSSLSTFTGNVTIEQGSLLITNSNALGTGTKTISAASALGGSLKLNATGIALPASFTLVTSNDDAVNPALVNQTGDNVIAGKIAPTTGGAGTGNTRILVTAGSLTLNGDITPQAGDAASLSVILAGASNGVVNGLISDNGTRTLGIVKEGAGIWTLNAANSYTGSTTVSEGRLNLTAGQTGGGALSIADSATLGVAVKVAGQSLQASSLTLGAISGGSLIFDLGAFSNPTSPVIQAGALTIEGSSIINVAGTGLGIGQFGLIGYSGTPGGAGFTGLTLGSLPARVTASLVDNVANSSVDLNITAFDIPKWTGEFSGDWDINDGADPTTGFGTANWKESVSGITTRYLQYFDTIDSVRFDDSAIGTTEVNLTTQLTPNAILVDNTSKDYTFTGSGYLSGTGSLQKQGTGTLTLTNTTPNDFSGGTLISAGTVVLGDGVTHGAGDLGIGTVTNQAALIFNRPDDFVFANPIAGNGTFTKQGAGILILSGNNASYAGNILINEGVLKLGGANALGNSTGITTVATGGTLDISGFAAVAEPITLQGGGILRVTSATNNRVESELTLSGDGSISTSLGTVLTLADVIQGNGGLTKTDEGTLILTHANTFSGGTIISSGRLQLGATNGAGIAGTLGAGDIQFNTISGQTATLAILQGSTPLQFTNNITSVGDGANEIIIGVSGAVSVSDIVTFSGNNTFAGNITINGGALRITQASALGSGAKTVRIASNAGPALLLDGSAANISIGSDVSFALSSDGSIVNHAANAGAIVNVAGNNELHGAISLINGGGGQGRLTVQSGTLTVYGNVNAEGATGNRNLVIGGAGSGTVAGLISDTNTAATSVVGVTKDGTGVWTLTGDNTYTGTVTIQAGTLKISTLASATTAQPLGLGTSALVLGTATTTGTFEYSGAPNAELTRPVTVNGIGGGIIRNNSGGLLTLTNTLTSAGRPLTLTGGSFALTGPIAGALAVLNLDATQVTLSSTASSFTGAAHVFNGSILKNAAAEVIPNAVHLTLGDTTNNSSGTYDLNGFNETIGGLHSAGTGSKIITNGAASGVATFQVTDAGSFDGIIQDGATAQTALTKGNINILSLSSVQTYTGKTTITGGTLALTGSGSIASSPWIQVDAAGTWDVSATTASYILSGSGSRALSGTGHITGSLTLEGSVTLSPGTSSDPALISTAGDGIGTLSFSHDLTLTGGTSINPRVILQLSGSTGIADPSDTSTILALADSTSGNFDRVHVTGTLVLDSSTYLQVALEQYQPVYGDVFNLFDWTSLTLNGFDASSGFHLPTLIDPNLEWRTELFDSSGIIYVGGAVPEPGRALLILASSSLLFSRRRRKTHA